MFQTVSKAGIGAAIVAVLNVLFPFLGVEMDQETLVAGVTNLVNAVGWFLLVWGQFDRKDLIAGLWRKSTIDDQI